MDQNLKNKINHLKDRIYITRKCRINSAESLKFWDNIISIINIYYSALLIIISLICIAYSSTINLNIFLISLSILIFAFNFLASYLQFKDRYYALKSNYLKLDLLSSKLDVIELNNQDSTVYYERYFIEYNELLNSTENHKKIDYYKALFTDKNLFLTQSQNNNLKINDIKKYINLKKSINGWVVLLLLIAPFVFPYIINLIQFLIKHTYCQ